MSKGATTIKVLRQNFIKKHQVHPDYFLQSERQLYEQDMFNDRDMFYPKQFQRTNRHQGPAKFVTIRQKDTTFKHLTALKLPLHPEKDKRLKVIPKSITPCLTERDERTHMVQNYNTIPCQPSFIKTEKLRRKVVSARENRRPMPKYSAYMYTMKPCSVGAVKMEPRPLSAFARSKSTDLNKYMGFGLNKQELSEKTKKAEHYFMPWQTQYQQI